jgi:hypothetical protein
MSAQQAEHWNRWEKSVITRSQTPLRTAVSTHRRDHLVLSVLVMFLMGMLLLGAPAFGRDAKDCLEHYENYGWLPGDCGEIIEVEGEAPHIFEPPSHSCPPGEIPTTWGECLPVGRGSGDGPGGGGGGGTHPSPDPCHRCRAQTSQCRQEVQDGVKRCLQWARSYAANVCTPDNPMERGRNCDGTTVVGTTVCVPIREGEEVRVDPRGKPVWECSGPSIDACIHHCMEGKPGAGTTGGITLNAQVFGLTQSATITVPPRDGFAKGCLEVGFQAELACASEKLRCDQAAQCPNPGSTPRIKFETEVLKEYPGIKLQPVQPRPRLNIPR